jgi:hypothetical protein
MRSFAVSVAVGAALLAVLASSASAQTTITQWSFNNTGTGNNAFQAGASGLVTGSAALARNFATMNAASAPFPAVIYSGASTDPGLVITNTGSPVGTYTYNRSMSASVPNLAAANKTAGAAFTVSTAAVSPSQQVQLSWSQTAGWRGSRYYQVLTSTSGTSGPFLPVTGGIGSNVSQFVNGYNSGTSPISGTATVNVSNDGIVDFRTINGNWLNLSVSSTGNNVYTPTGVNPSNYAAGFVDNISYTLPTGQGFEGNPNFAFAIVSIWDPSLSATSGTTGLVSSFAGTDSTDSVSGYTNSAANGGALRFDLVTVSAVPEPTTWAMLGTSALIGGSLAWRRRSRCEIDV